MARATEALAPGNSDRICISARTPRKASSLKQGSHRQWQTTASGETNLENLLTTLLALPAAPRSLFCLPTVGKPMETLIG